MTTDSVPDSMLGDGCDSLGVGDLGAWFRSADRGRWVEQLPERLQAAHAVRRERPPAARRCLRGQHPRQPGPAADHPRPPGDPVTPRPTPPHQRDSSRAPQRSSTWQRKCRRDRADASSCGWVRRITSGSCWPVMTDRFQDYRQAGPYAPSPARRTCGNAPARQSGRR